MNLTATKIAPITPEPETPGAFGAIFFRVEQMSNGTYQCAFCNMDRKVLDTMRPGDWVEIRKIEKT